MYLEGVSQKKKLWPEYETIASMLQLQDRGAASGGTTAPAGRTADGGTTAPASMLQLQDRGTASRGTTAPAVGAANGGTASGGTADGGTASGGTANGGTASGEAASGEGAFALVHTGVAKAFPKPAKKVLFLRGSAKREPSVESVD